MRILLRPLSNNLLNFIICHFILCITKCFGKIPHIPRRHQICPLYEHIVCNSAENLALSVSPLLKSSKREDDNLQKQPLLRQTSKSKLIPVPTSLDLACTCAMTLHETAAEQPSCTHLVSAKNEDNFEAISAILLVDAESQERAESWAPPLSTYAPLNVIEAKLRRDLAATFNTKEQNIIILRIRCSDEEEDVDDIIAKLTTINGHSIGETVGSGLPKPQFRGAFQFAARSPPQLLTIQFVVLKRNGAGKKAVMPPFVVETELVDARLAANRIRTAYSQKALAGLRLLYVQAVDELFDVEAGNSNSALIIQALFATAFIIATMLCGCWVACKKKHEYDDDLQKI